MRVSSLYVIAAEALSHARAATPSSVPTSFGSGPHRRGMAARVSRTPELAMPVTSRPAQNPVLLVPSRLVLAASVHGHGHVATRLVATATGPVATATSSMATAVAGTGRRAGGHLATRPRSRGPRS